VEKDRVRQKRKKRGRERTINKEKGRKKKRDWG
jgi:hypothetical protein